MTVIKLGSNEIDGPKEEAASAPAAVVSFKIPKPQLKVGEMDYSLKLTYVS